MPRNAAIEAVLAAEEAGRLWERELLGFPVWGLERFRRYCQHAQADSALTSNQPRGAERAAAELRAVAASLGDLRRGAPPARGRDIWLLSSSSYRRQGEGGARCIFADHLQRQLGDRLLFVEFNTARMPSLERDDTCFIDAVQVPLLTAAKAAAGPLARLARLPSADTLAAFAPTSGRRLVDRALYGRGLLEVGRRWMDRNPPTAVFVLCGYNMHVPLQLAAAERGIPVIELQHGIVHESHAGYVYDQLPGVSPVPDHLVTFGAYFGRLVEREAPRWKGRWTVGGHPWLKAKAKSAAGPGERRTVLLFSQYLEPTRSRIRDVAATLRRRLPEPWHVALKPHPREADAAEFFAPAIDAGVELVPHSADSYVRLGTCDVAVSEYSTVSIEALAFPCRSVALRSPKWTEAMVELVEQGVLEAAGDGEDLAELVQREVPPGRRAEIARDLFGVGEPEPDFGALIERLKR